MDPHWGIAYTDLNTHWIFCILMAFISLFLITAVFLDENSCFYFSSVNLWTLYSTIRIRSKLMFLIVKKWYINFHLHNTTCWVYSSKHGYYVFTNSKINGDLIYVTGILSGIHSLILYRICGIFCFLKYHDPLKYTSSNRPDKCSECYLIQGCH